MSLSRCLRPLPFGIVFALCLGTAAVAAPPDRDYETVSPASRPSAPAPPPPSSPPGLSTSPLAVTGKTAGPPPRMRFVMRDGTVLVGDVLGFDGRMYALRLPHGAMLARKDLFTAVTPLRSSFAARTPPRPARPLPVRVGARF